MNDIRTDADNQVPDGWIRVALIGGPHHGQRMNVPTDQADLALFDGVTPHAYFRLSDKHELHHGDRLARMLGAVR